MAKAEGRPADTAWRLTSAVGRAVGFAGITMIAAIVFGRWDLVVLAAPFLIGTTLALRARPSSRPTISVRAGPVRADTDAESAVPERRLREGEQTELEIVVTNPSDVAMDAVLLTLPDQPELGIVNSGRTIAVPAPAKSSTGLTLGVDLKRWGRPEFGRVEARALACAGFMSSDSSASETLQLKAFPRTEKFEAEDAMPDAAGLVGAHRSRRYGDGGELADIRRFQPGDRLRRIDWRTSLRAREIHVVQTLSDRDTDLAVVLDVLHEAGSEPSVLDQTVRAAAGIADHYLGRGDRITLAEFGGRGRTLRSASGPRQRILSLEWLLDVRPGEGRFGPSGLPRGRALVPDRALVVVLTPLLDERSTSMLAELARSHRSLVAVDTLPPGIEAPPDGPWTELAFRLWKLDRQNTIARLLEHGVPVVQWAGAGSLDHVLRGLSRMAATR